MKFEVLIAVNFSFKFAFYNVLNAIKFHKTSAY